MKILTENDGVFTIETDQGTQTWISSTGFTLAVRKRLEDMVESNEFKPERLTPYAFYLKEECCSLDTEDAQGISQDWLNGLDLGFKVGFLNCFGYALEDLLSDATDLDSLFMDTWNDIYGSEDSMEIEGSESDEELDDKVAQYFERHGFTRETKDALYESVVEVGLRNRLRLRYGK